jgi:hypothetical protein
MLSKSYIFFIGIVISLFLIVFNYADVQAQDQIITPEPHSISVSPGEEFTFSVRYDVSDGNNELTGIGIRMHYDSSNLEFVEVNNVFEKDKLQIGSPQDDTGNQDGDDDTDKIIIAAWADISPPADWPGEALPLGLFDVKFKVKEGLASSSIKFTASGTSSGYGFSSNSLHVAIDGLPSPIADIKINGQDGPLTLHQSDTLSLAIGLDNNGHTDQADWWLAVNTPAGLYTFYSWVPYLETVCQGPLCPLDSLEVLNIPVSGLPSGTYTFYFGVDTNMDGQLSLSPGILHFDYIEVNIEP